MAIKNFKNLEILPNICDKHTSALIRGEMYFVDFVC